MRFLLLIVLGALIAARAAEVNVEVQLDQDQFLRNESMPLRVRISNFSGQKLRLGEEPGWLTFQVLNSEGRDVARLGEVELPKPFTVDAAKTISLRADISPYFDLSQAGRYTVSARVHFAQLQKAVSSDAKAFDIINGVRLWDREVGVPGSTPPVVRKYTLQQAGSLKQARCYVRISEDNDARVVRVVPLGGLLSFSTPEAATDNSSQLHVLFQVGARSFLYSVVTPDGEQIIRQTWDYTTTRPRLHVESDGRVVVRGGARRILLSDLPPPRVADTNDSRPTN
jgi:hypothetical protein